MKRIFFIVIAIVLAVFVGYVSYNSSQYTHINGLIDDAVAEKKYSEVAKIFGGCCDTKSIVEKETEDIKLVVFNGTAMIDLSYGNSERFQAYEETYLIYLFDSNFDYQTYDSQNQTALVFTDGVDEFKYPFIVSDAVNSDLYKATKNTLDEALFNEARNLTANDVTWGFMYLNLTKSMVNHIESVLGDSITNISLVDTKGKEVVSADITLDFSQKFFADINELVTQYNGWLLASKNGNNQEANNKFNTFYDQWLTEFENNKDKTGYSLPYDQSYLAPSSLIWKSAGYLLLYGVIMLFFYIVLFKLDSFKEKLTKKNVARAQAEIALERQNNNQNQNTIDVETTEVENKEE